MRDIAIGPFRTGELLVTGLTLLLVFVGGVLPRVGNALGRWLRRDPAAGNTTEPHGDTPPDGSSSN